MGKDTEMQYLNFPARKSAAFRASRTKHILATILLLLCIPIAIYQLVPRFTHATDQVVDALVDRIRGADLCTADVGDRHCCALFLAAAPCVDECRKTHVDRETWVVTKEYDECADVCLAAYTSQCQPRAVEVD